jgi:methylated-DNA-protein-cysteine methyltransferase related protein
VPDQGRNGGEANSEGAGSEDYAELVLEIVERIPPGRVMTYGDVAEYLGRGGPRQVGTALSRHGAAVPWWRVIRADGRPVPGLADEALRLLGGEGCPLHGDRVDLLHGGWFPPLDQR